MCVRVVHRLAGCDLTAHVTAEVPTVANAHAGRGPTTAPRRDSLFWSRDVVKTLCLIGPGDHLFHVPE